jgi:hypothetical protein
MTGRSRPAPADTWCVCGEPAERELTCEDGTIIYSCVTPDPVKIAELSSQMTAAMREPMDFGPAGSR